MVIKFYTEPGSPPCFAVEACLTYLKVPYESILVDFAKSEHHTEEYKKKNPASEIPCIEDDGFFLSESAAILQYLAEKYKKDETLYPTDFQTHGKINHLLCFNNTNLYKTIVNGWFLPTFYAYPKLELHKKHMKHFLGVFDKILCRHKGPYAAGTTKITIADMHLLKSYACFDVYGVDLSPYPNIKKWTDHIQKNDTEIWKLVQKLKDDLKPFVGPLDPAFLPKSHPYMPCSPAEYV